MPGLLATAVYALGILGLFTLDRDPRSRTSPALWIAVAWLSIGASRNVGEWLGTAPVLASPDQYLDGSPLDRVIFTGLLAAGVMVLLTRGQRTGALLRANAPLVAFFLFCAVSVVWSDYPVVAFKRWAKALGNAVIVLVVLTDPDPRAAVKQLLARSGFLLVPLSVLLIKYYPALGRGFDFWTGRAYNMGVAIDKNGLGVICIVFGLGSLWRLLAALNTGQPSRMARPLIVHGAVLAMALWLFSMADSATSLGCFIIGGALLVLTNWWAFTRSPTVVSVLTVGTVSACVFGLFFNTDVGVVQAMGRDPTLTTRTELWANILRIPVDPLFGTGFESFWLGERAKELWRIHWWHPNQAHNGYLEVYLNLGWIGVTLLGVMMVWGYRNVVGALRADPELGRLNLAFFVAAVVYNLTEAAFKVTHPIWIAFLLAVAASSAVAEPSTSPGPRAPLAPPSFSPGSRRLPRPRGCSQDSIGSRHDAPIRTSMTTLLASGGPPPAHLHPRAHSRDDRQ